MDGKSIQGSKVVVEWAGSSFSKFISNSIKAKIKNRLETEMATQNKKSASTAERKVTGKNYFPFSS